MTLKMRTMHADMLFMVDDATLDDIREAVNTLEETERTVRRVLGGSHPLTAEIEDSIREAGKALRARGGA